MLDFLAVAFAGDPRPYARLLKGDVDTLLKAPEAYLFHEFLEEENEPLYFHEFASRLPAHELQYLGDPLPANMFAVRYGSELAERVVAMGDDLVSVEQHLDVARAMTFRQSLVCHQTVSLERQLKSERAAALYFAGDVRPAGGELDLQSSALSTFMVDGKWQMLTAVPVVKSAFCHLGREWPRAVSLDELAEAARAALGSAAPLSEADRELLAIDLLGRVVMGRLEVFGAPSPFVKSAGPRPLAGVVARRQAAAGGVVTNRRHELVRLDPLSASLLAALDGRRSRKELAAVLAAAARALGLPPASDSASAELVEQRLTRLAALRVVGRVGLGLESRSMFAVALGKRRPRIHAMGAPRRIAPSASRNADPSAARTDRIAADRSMALTTAASTYDDIGFPEQCLPKTHPDRLAAVASLFGMRTEPVERCRVLELGCASGSNLLPMADRHPESTFVGVDSSPRQIARAQRAAASLGLANAEFRQMEFTDIDSSLGAFDYIICHGVYSWVAPAVQGQVLAICRDNLRPQGVAFISYNAYPGWHFENTIRFLACGAAAVDDPPARRVASARKLLEVFSAVLAEEPAPHGRLLKQSIDTLLAKPDGYLFHDHMEAENHPLLFHEFVERAAAHGLEYLADATPGTMFASALGPLVEEALLRIAGELVSVEQHLDVLRNRTFRQSLMCHRGVPLVRQLRAASAYGLRFSGNVPPREPARDVASAEPQDFLPPDGQSISLSVPATKAAVVALSQVWPHTLSFDELARAAAERLGRQDAGLSPEERDLLGRELVYLALNGILEIHAAADRFVTTISRCPTASPWARSQALASPLVTSRRHEQVQLDDVARNLLVHLDGRHDRQELVGVLNGAVERGEITILRNALPAGRGEHLKPMLETILDRTLATCAANALLIA